jgi:hypothetical protein
MLKNAQKRRVMKLSDVYFFTHSRRPGFEEVLRAQNGAYLLVSQVLILAGDNLCSVSWP